jgi:hypothetical protein
LSYCAEGGWSSQSHELKWADDAPAAPQPSTHYQIDHFGGYCVALYQCDRLAEQSKLESIPYKAGDVMLPPLADPLLQLTRVCGC